MPTHAGTPVPTHAGNASVNHGLFLVEFVRVNCGKATLHHMPHGEAVFSPTPHEKDKRPRSSRGKAYRVHMWQELRKPAQRTGKTQAGETIDEPL